MSGLIPGPLVYLHGFGGTLATIALCVICKNEEKNLPRLLESVEGCFDEIHIADTGSTDGTLAYLETRKDVTVHHFKWVDDFSEARNFVFSKATAEYCMWLDCDDVLDSKEAFIDWKNTLLTTANYWFATYHYGLDADGSPVCSFVRERIIKNFMGMKWMHFIHEGIPPVVGLGKIVSAYVSSWSVKHLRSEDDVKADRNRNLGIFEKNRHKMNNRLEYYYGKELFEANQPMEAYAQLTKSMDLPDLEPHDKILCVQYACMAAMNCNQFEKAIELAHKGLRMTPQRAELYVIIADCYVKLTRFDDSIPYYIAASNCPNPTPGSATFHQPLFTDAKCYKHYPRNQLARVYFQKGEVQESKRYLEQALLLGPDPETGALYAEILNVEKGMAIPPKGSIPVADEYVITSPHHAMYLWDENELKNRGIGGSETAAIRMARELHKLSGKKVRVFMERNEDLEIDGVVYVSNLKMRQYFKEFEPKAHIAWRHNVKMTHAPTFVWCHDLCVSEIEHNDRFEKILALSEFHKSLLMHTFRVPEEKISVTRNGIDLEKFEGIDFSKKDPLKLVYSSSPDRGLDNAINVVKKAREVGGLDFKLHAFYGLENMSKLGMHDEVARLKRLIKDNPWVIYHGNVQQNELMNHFKDASIWLYPTNFLETFCITALEMLACKVHPLVRSYGALPNTLAGTVSTILDSDCTTAKEIDHWAEELVFAHNYLIKSPQPDTYLGSSTWNSVAEEWLTWLPK